jgi:hypothetical protein
MPFEIIKAIPAHPLYPEENRDARSDQGYKLSSVARKNRHSCRKLPKLNLIERSRFKHLFLLLYCVLACFTGFIGKGRAGRN